MRQLTVNVPAGKGKAVTAIAKEHEAVNVTLIPGEETDYIELHLANRKVHAFLDEISDFKHAKISLNPRGIIPLHEPADEAPGQVRDPDLRSPIEIYLEGIQSIGSFRGMILYCICAGLIVWTAMFTNSVFLLIASMLIAPFAGPAMNSAIGAAAGDFRLVRRSVGRYFLSIGITMLICMGLTVLIGMEEVTDLMEESSKVPVVAMLLPLAAGVAGALNLMQSQRDGLVSGAAVGVLVAASLAPPVAVVGIATVMGQWEMVKSSIFLLLLQLAVIHFSALIMFRFVGKVKTNGARFLKGKKNAFRISLPASLLAAAALLTWQFTSSPDLNKGSLDTRVEGIVRKEVKRIPGLRLASVNADVSKMKEYKDNPVIINIGVYRNGNNQPEDYLVSKMRENILDEFRKQKLKMNPVFLFNFYRD